MKRGLPWREVCSLKDPNLPEHSLMTREDGGSWGERNLGEGTRTGQGTRTEGLHDSGSLYEPSMVRAEAEGH